MSQNRLRIGAGIVDDGCHGALLLFRPRIGRNQPGDDELALQVLSGEVSAGNEHPALEIVERGMAILRDSAVNFSKRHREGDFDGQAWRSLDLLRQDLRAALARLRAARSR